MRALSPSDSLLSSGGCSAESLSSALPPYESLRPLDPLASVETPPKNIRAATAEQRLPGEFPLPSVFGKTPAEQR